MSMHRRNFLKALGAGAGWLAAGSGRAAETSDAGAMPRRVFGRSGIQVPILSLGGMFDIPNNQVVLHQALALGVTYWDTADCYGGGKSETGIGQFFARQPEARARVFLVTKSDDRTIAGMDRLLNRSLERMQTNYVDMYFIHWASSIAEITPEMKTWAEQAKRDGKIKLFGFSTHKNMVACMSGAAELGWIDGVMVKYDFRLMHNDDMKRAVEACTKAGIGLTAMKTMGGGPVRTDSEAELALAGKFMQRGLTEHQAKLKAVWENESIASICSQMPNVTLLKANAAAARDQTPLSSSEREALQAYARATHGQYCAGCGARCESASGVPVCDIMRHLMYAHSYGDAELARASFQNLPGPVRVRLGAADLTAAEAACPHRLPVARLVREALASLS